MKVIIFCLIVGLSYVNVIIKVYSKNNINTFAHGLKMPLGLTYIDRYDRVFRRLQPLAPNNRNYAAGKTKLAAWFISHCNAKSGRNRQVT